jgi:hypothetical protein
LHFSFQLSIDGLGFTLAAIFELTREVFLPDQSDAHSKWSKKGTQELFDENTVEICGWLCKKWSDTTAVKMRDS